MIYADNAATTPVSPAARAAMIDAMDKLWGNPPACTPSASGPRRR